jgi:hypothetical protein
MIAPPPQGRGQYSRKKTSASSKNSHIAFWCVISAVLVAAVSFVFLLAQHDKRTETPERPAKKIVKDPKPVNRPKTKKAEALGEVEQKAAEIPVPPVGNVMTARTAKAGRVMTLMDGTVITNIVERPFKRDLEHSLWVALRPGNMGAGLLTTLQNRHSEHEIIEMLKEMTVPEEGDSEGMIRIKQEVQELKEKILIELDSGRSLSDVFDEIRNQGVAESKIKADTMRLRAEAIRSGDPEQVRETVRRANEIRAKQGLEPLTVPEEFQSPDEDAPAKQTYTEFEDEEENS